MSKVRIVMVEDNPGDIEALRIALDRQREPYELAILRDGAEALQYLRDGSIGIREPGPCVILLDLHLPKYDGLEVLEALRREPGLRHVQVLVVTSGPPHPREEENLRRLDAVFRQKPRDFPEVLDLAAEIIAMCKKTAAAA